MLTLIKKAREDRAICRLAEPHLPDEFAANC